MMNAATVQDLTYTVQEAGKDRVILNHINCSFEAGKNLYHLRAVRFRENPRLLYAMAGLLDQVRGEVHIGETEMLRERRRTRDRIRLEKIGIVFQNLKSV